MREPKLWVVVEKDPDGIDETDYTLFPTELEALRFANEYMKGSSTSTGKPGACTIFPLYLYGEWLSCIEAAHLDEIEEEEASNEPAA